MLVIYASFSLRRRIGVRNWRRLHYLTFGVFGAATVHGLAAGTDRWALPLYAGSVAAVDRPDRVASPDERRNQCPGTGSKSIGRCVAEWRRA